jgi:hypothetical protein
VSLGCNQRQTNHEQHYTSEAYPEPGKRLLSIKMSSSFSGFHHDLVASVLADAGNDLKSSHVPNWLMQT